MLKKAIATAICALGAAATVWCATEVYDASNFSAAGRKWQPVPVGHDEGKDNGAGLGDHHPGEDCGICHKPGGKAGAKPWTMGGTIYDSRFARLPVEGAEVVMQDCNGNVISMTSNEFGNFWTKAEVASNPWTVATPHGGGASAPMYTVDANGALLTPADPEDARTWRYKAWVRQGDTVRPMITVAGIGGSETTTRMGCSMHHAGLGSRGGLWVQTAQTLPEYPSSGLSYRKHIFPILRSKCAPCHIPGASVTSAMTKSDLDNPPTTQDYSGGLDLMTYEGSTVRGVSKAGVQSVVDPSDPGNSVLLAKTVKGATHGGGSFWSASDADYRALLKWIAEGAQKN